MKMKTEDVDEFAEIEETDSAESATARELYACILDTSHIALRAETNFLRRFGLNHARVGILTLLDEAPEGSLRSAELADLAKVSRATITGLVDGLDREGLIDRTKDPHDRRSFTIKISKRGESLLEQVKPVRDGWMEKIIADMGEDKSVALIELLRRVQHSIERVSA